MAKLKYLFLCSFFIGSITHLVSAAPAADISNSSKATLLIRAADRSPYPVPKYITGKFCEHLGSNIYHGMDAQILRNPTLAGYPFGTGPVSPDGVTGFLFDRKEIAKRIRRQAQRIGWPKEEIEGVFQAYEDGLACFWARRGKRDDVKVSPDVGKYGQRAQRIELTAPGQGITQWTYLPLRRIRQYEFELIARSPNLKSLTVTLTAPDSNTPCSKATITGLSENWKKFKGTLKVASHLPTDTAYKFALTANAPGQFVVERIMLLPADHINGADPELIRLFREYRLPILRWPGGNFVSSYHWEDGIGPCEKRPTLPNYVWGGLETNQFGTDEFIAYCRAVGCEPMICVNAGSGTPAEAARWIQYCNGDVDTPMGALRAANGHPKPYNVRYWEVGNELYGRRWQCYWTTASGYVDRYKNFAKAMSAADPTIKLYACGRPAINDSLWNDMLIKDTAPLLKATTDHILIGGRIPSDTDPFDVYRDFMAVPEILEDKWSALEQKMKDAGIKDPRLAITELQLFGRITEPSDANAPVRLTRKNFVTSATFAEALYDIMIYHAAIRTAPFVEMVTHSATVNHGGGLKKRRQRVFANPCHYAQAMFADFVGATPVDMDLKSPREQAPLILSALKRVTSPHTYDSINALAAITSDETLLISIVHRGTKGPIQLAISIEGFDAGRQAELRTLSADKPWAQNTFDEPERIKPSISFANIRNNMLTLDVQPYTFMRIQIPRASRR